MSDAAAKGRQASVEGFANEHIAVGILMKKYANVSLVDLPLSPYDIVIVRKQDDGTEDIIRAQVKTAKKKIDFGGGGRAGVDRTYKSDVKTYTHSTLTSDVVIGLHCVNEEHFELYFVPTVLIEALRQKSISLTRVRALRENYEILENCKNRQFVLQTCTNYGLTPGRRRPAAPPGAPPAEH